MHKLYYQPEGHWFGDCMPFGHDGRFYLYHQRDTRNPAPLENGQPFGWSLATTSDFVHYKDYGEALKKGAYDAQDQYIYAGSVFEAEGEFHAFYTGFNREYAAQGKASQVLMHAVSKDLVNWEKNGDQLTFTPQPGYDKDDWRDPFVLYNEEEQEYLLILGARKLDGKKLLNGCTVHFTSRDLKNWEFKGDFWAPNIYTMHEMPDLFRIGEWWYLIISEYSDKNKIVYRMSRSLKGPWTAPVDDAFDGRAYYAGRTHEVNGQRILFGWVPTKENNDDLENFQWGGTFVPHEVYQRPDGTLAVKIPDTVWDAFADRKPVQNPVSRLETADSRKEAVLEKDCGDIYSFEADVKFTEGTRSFAVKMYENEETGEAYQFKFYIGENRMVFEKTPNQPWFQCMNIGLERPIPLDAGEFYHMRMIVDDTIATIYVNGTALNARMYKRPGNSLGMDVVDGTLEIKNASVAKGLK